MHDCTKTCARLGDGCATCEQTSTPGELPTGYVPRSEPLRTEVWVAEDRNGADALEPRR